MGCSCCRMRALAGVVGAVPCAARHRTASPRREASALMRQRLIALSSDEPCGKDAGGGMERSMPRSVSVGSPSLLPQVQPGAHQAGLTGSVGALIAGG